MKDLSFALVDDSRKSETDIVEAKFKDDSVHAVPGFTYADLRALVRRSAAPNTAGVLWSREHKITHHLIHVGQRIDRCLLLSLYEQTAQRLQIRIDKFGPVDDQNKQLDADSPVLKLAMDIMVPIAEKFASGVYEIKDLTPARNEAMRGLATAAAAAKASARATTAAAPNAGLAKATAVPKGKARAKATTKDEVPAEAKAPPSKKAKLNDASDPEVAYVPIGDGTNGNDGDDEEVASAAGVVQRFFSGGF
jgi:hypothetical protein